MRPAVLFPLFADVAALPGIGKASAAQLANLNINKISDCLWHLPTGIIDRSHMPPLDQLKEGDIFTTIIHVDKHIPSPKHAKAKIPYKVLCSNETGTVTLVFFSVHGDYLRKSLPEGEMRVISGRAEFFSGNLQVSHPDYILPVSDLEKVKKVEPVYPLTQGFTLKKMHKLISAAISQMPDLPEWIEPNYIKKQKWENWKNSVVQIHNPQKAEDLLPISNARQRLAFDELLANQLTHAVVRSRVHKKPAEKIDGKGELRKKLIENLPFKLTEGQKDSLQEIYKDMASGKRMLRLLQGDVGSGKTVVSLLSMLNAVECGKQGAIMAPTEILCRQHYNWIKKVTSPLGISIEIITGKTKGAERSRLQKAMKDGSVDIVVGTHAVFQEGIAFKNLGMAVIDEQHRFGVEQRLSLAAKGDNIHILLMSATPIPRTLTMTFYGDMDVSLLKEKPKGRMGIDTRAIPISRMDEVIAAIQRAIDQDEKIYWICPLVELSEKTDLAAAEERFETFKKIFGDKVGLIHGRMKQDSREAEMQAFASGNKQLLVATTVIEVGVDVPDATIMIIEHAERFGLSQLHQLRGRVGRGSKASSCLLLYGEPLGEIAKQRLKVIKHTEDGFVIAEEDLKLRGGGDLLGTKQSGFPDFKVASIADHIDLLVAARDYTKMIMEKDPDLKTEAGSALRTLLYLFEYDQQVKYIQAA